MMISDEELAQLPEDPELAFVEFERILRAQVDRAELQEKELIEDNVPVPNIANATRRKREYIVRILAAAKAYGISQLAEWRVPSAHDDIEPIFSNFISDVEYFTTEIRIRNISRDRRYSVGLDGNTKAKIHTYIQHIKEAIEKSNLPEDRKDRLYDKLHAFALEIDKSRTNLQACMAVYIAVCDGIGQGFKKLEPVRKMIDSISTLLGRAKEVEDSLRLPSPPELKRIEAPHGKLSSPNGEEEIPF